jgi:hypothetical protein
VGQIGVQTPNKRLIVVSRVEEKYGSHGDSLSPAFDS